MSHFKITYDFGYSILKSVELKNRVLELLFERVFNWEVNPKEPEVFNAMITLDFLSGTLDRKQFFIGKKLESCELYALKVGYVDFLPYDPKRLGEITEIRVVNEIEGQLIIQGSNFSIVKNAKLGAK